MPRTRRAPGNRPRAPKTARALLDDVVDCAFDIEQPLTAAEELVQALRMIGDGMAADGNDQGLPIAAVARVVSDRLDALKRAWLAAIKAGRRRSNERAVVR